MARFCAKLVFCSSKLIVIVAAFALSMALLPGSALSADDWPMFLKNRQHSGRVSDAPVPPLSLKWAFSTGGAIYSSPVVVGTTVYFGSYDSKLYAVDMRSGKKLWQFKTGGAILSTPAVSDGKVFFGSKDRNVYALDARSGKKLWNFKTGGAVVASPVVAGGKVFIGSKDIYFYALNAKNGKRIWRKRLPDNDRYSGIYSSAAYFKGAVYVAAKNGSLYSFDQESGARNWAEQVGSAIYSSPVVNAGMVYIATYDRMLYAYNTATGKRVWRKRLSSWPYSSPAVYGAKLYLGLKNGQLDIYSKSRGTLMKAYLFPDEINSTVVATSDGRVYVGCDDGYFYVLDSNTGGMLWKYKTGGGIHSSPAISGGLLFVGSKDGNMYAFGP